jgi:RNA polymerase sigma factor for flagellar operon FliA
MLESAASSRLMSFEQLDQDPERSMMLPESPDEGPERALEGDQFRDALAAAIERLPEREQLVLSLYYDEELNLREIGEVLNVSESRVCQIHGQAVLRVRTRMHGWLEED